MSEEIEDGVHIAILTPFTEGEVNYPKLGSHLEYLNRFPISGVVTSGVTGEGLSLSVKERNGVL